MNYPVVSKAVFADENELLYSVSVTIDLAGVDVSFDYETGAPPEVVHFSPRNSLLQLSEGLQFASDIVGNTVPGRMSAFVRGWTNAAAESHDYAWRNGFWEDKGDRTSELLMWAVTELGEAFSAAQRGNPPDPKVPEFSAVEVEIADTLIILMDLAYSNGWRVAEAVEAKMKLNKTRPYKHNKPNA